MIEQDFTAEQAVAAGVALLDAKVPGWRNRINRETFDMTNGDNCIVGHVFRHLPWPWLDGRSALGLHYYNADQYGFIVFTEDELGEMDYDATMALTPLWLAALDAVSVA